MNVYDFDKTIYSGDSTIDFWKFCCKAHPKILFRSPKMFWYFGLYFFGLIDKTKFKEVFFEFLKDVTNIEDVVTAFWNRKITKIRPWYLELREPNDLIISASPEFLLKPVAEKIDFRIIASRVDSLTGLFNGKNCYGEEKVRRLSVEYDINSIDSFYSDSLSDEPLAKLAKKAYIVSNEQSISWNEYHPPGIKKIKTTFITKEFILFVFCGGMGTLTNFVISLLTSMVINPTVAYVIGFTLSLFVTYSLSAHLIFKKKIQLITFIKFIISYVPNFIIQILFVAIFLNIFCWERIIVYLLACALGLPISFLLVKVYAFRKKSIKTVEEYL